MHHSSSTINPNTGRRARRAVQMVLALLAVLLTIPMSAITASAQESGDAPPTQARSRAAAGYARIDDAVAAGRLDPEVLTELRRSGKVTAILTVTQRDVVADATREAVDPAKRRGSIDRMGAEFKSRKRGALDRSGGEVRNVQDFEHLANSVVEIRSPRALLKLLNDPEVEGVTANRQMQRGAMDAQSAPLIRQPQAAAAGYTGAGTFVAVLDTGVDYTRSDFGYCSAPNTGAGCRVWAALDFGTNDNVRDDNGHGTNVAGIVAGIAPAARIIDLDVFSGTTAPVTNMLGAMNWLITQKRAGVNIVAANLSIWIDGIATPNSCVDDLAFGTARSVGIIPVVISGNGGQTTGVSYPGCIPGALTVGAVYDSNVGGRVGSCTDTTTWADKVTCFSQSGPNLKVLAPGSIITAAGISQSGTSQAAPHVAGAVAVLAAARPSAGITAWESAIVNSGPSILDRDGRYRRRLDVSSAVTTLVGSGDRTAPAVVSPRQSVALNWTLGATAVPVNITWSASDASGIAGYELYSSTNGGAWAKETLATATSTNKVFNLTPGSTYRFTVAAKDGAGNWSGWADGAQFTVVDRPENSTSIGYSTGWTRSPWASALGGYVTGTATANASATFTFTGRSVSWIASKAANRGQAYVYIDGVYQGTWELYSATTQARAAVMTMDWTASGTHTVKIVAVGTSGRPTVDIDSFIVLG